MRLSWAIGALVAAGGSGTPEVLRAQVRASPPSPSEFAVDRFDPSEPGGEWFVLDALDFRGHLRSSVAAVGDWALNPFVVSEGQNQASIVAQDPFFLHLGGSLVLSERWRVGLDWPIAVFSQSGGGVSGASYVVPLGASSGQLHVPAAGASGASLRVSTGDLRASVDVRIAGTYGGPLSLAAGVALYVPEPLAYVGAGDVRVVPRVKVAGDFGSIAYAATLGWRFGATSDGGPLGDGLVLGVSAGARLLRRTLLVGPEVYGSVLTRNVNANPAQSSTPTEALLGAHYAPTEEWRIGAGLGTGLTQGMLDLRAVLSLQWTPGLPPARFEIGSSGSGDSICPGQSGSGETAEAPASECPPLDRDHDSIVDSEDACPDMPGVGTSDPKTNTTNGCPPDRDHDGILDAEDACPELPGVKTEDPTTNGCRGARIESGEIRVVEHIRFAYDSAELLPEGEAALEDVRDILAAHPEIARIRIEGYSDDVGPRQYNRVLSQRRARTVVDWLVAHGIATARLRAAGYGEERPEASNEDEEGRRSNRRVEIHIESVTNGQERAVPAPAASSAPAAAPPPPPGANMGRIVVPANFGRHRVWVDEHLVGESPGAFGVPCGEHSVRIGHAGAEKKVNVSCGGETHVH